MGDMMREYVARQLLSRAIDDFLGGGCPHGCSDRHCPWWRRLQELGIEALAVTSKRPEKLTSCKGAGDPAGDDQ